MSFGLKNSRETFMALMNGVFITYLYLFVIVVIEDILICSTNEEDHESHLWIVLQTLRDKELYSKFSKCELWLKYVAFLGHIFSSKGIRVTLRRLEQFRVSLDPHLHQI